MTDKNGHHHAGWYDGAAKRRRRERIWLTVGICIAAGGLGALLAVAAWLLGWGW